MDRIYMNRIEGQRRIHVEIHENEVSDLLDDLKADPEHFASTRLFLGILRVAEEIFLPAVSETRRNREGAARAASGQQPETTPCACTHPQDRHLSACTECPCIGYAPTWPPTKRRIVPVCDQCGAPWATSHRCATAPAVGQPAEAQATGQHRPPCVNGNHCGEPAHCPPSPAYERLQAVAAKTNREMAGATLRAYKRIYQLAHNATGPIQPSDILDALKDPEPDPAKLLAAITAEAQPADRAAVLDEAADAVERENADCLVTIVGRPCQPCATRAAVAAHLRRMAEEARS